MNLQIRILQLSALKADRFDELKAARNRLLEDPTSAARLNRHIDGLRTALMKFEAVRLLLNAALFDLMISGISHRRYLDFVRRLDRGD